MATIKAPAADYLRDEAQTFLADFLEYLAEETRPTPAEDPAGYADMVPSLADTFARFHPEHNAEHCRAVFLAVLRAAGGLVYAPDLDGAPCVTCADYLRSMTRGAKTWNDAIKAHDAQRL